MNKAFKIPIAIIVITLLSASSCKKEPIKVLGPEDYRVTFGNQTFGAYLNGQPWIPDYSDPGNGIGPIDIKMLVNGSPNSPIKLWATASKNNEQLSVFVPANISLGRVEFNTNDQTYPTVSNPPAYGYFSIHSSNKSYKTNTQFTGFINIKQLDSYWGKLEAEFEFTAVNQTSGETIKITNGYLKRNL